MIKQKTLTLLKSLGKKVQIWIPAGMAGCLSMSASIADVEGWRYGLLVLSLRFVFKDYVTHEQQKTL